jgi:hypothetical protein
MYSTGFQRGEGSIIIEFYSNPIYKFTCTKSIQNLTVPTGFNYMYVDITGAASGSGGISTPAGTPGYGARVRSYLKVIPGSLLHVIAGCKGTNCPSTPLLAPTYFSGGYNGGGSGHGFEGEPGGSGGGGASDIRLNGLTLRDRIIVAGGGGGYFCHPFCGPQKGGDGGRYGQAGSGLTGVPACCANNHLGGSGGTNSTGGIAGYTCTGTPSTNGILGFGGNGESSNVAGGGGGYYGGGETMKILKKFVLFYFYVGGGGVDTGGAGGGSSYSSGSNTIYNTGVQTSSGTVSIEFYTNPSFKFSCTKSIQNVTVPAGYNYMYVDMSGAASGSGGGYPGTAGYGARVQSYLSVTPGQVLQVIVGCKGTACQETPVTQAYPGGYNGGGAGWACGSGGGGASDIRIRGGSVTDRVIVAGGGGGYYCGVICGTPKGGDGGKYGNTGYPSGTCSVGVSPSGGGNWTSGGPPGGPVASPLSTRGGLGFGGNGGGVNAGGGGGGYFGGESKLKKIFLLLLFCY